MVRKAFRPMAPIRVDNESIRFDSVTPDQCPVRPTVVLRPRVTSRLRSVIFRGPVGQTTKTRGNRVD